MTSTAKDEPGKRQSRVNAVRHGLTARDKDSAVNRGGVGAVREGKRHEFPQSPSEFGMSLLRQVVRVVSCATRFKQHRRAASYVSGQLS
jgi:hypothetical protein